MRILLDECVPARLRYDIHGHDVTTIGANGWLALKNGELLRRAAVEFDAFVTVDRGIRHQQSLPLTLRLITISGPSNTLTVLRRAIPALLTALETAVPGESVVVDAN